MQGMDQETAGPGKMGKDSLQCATVGKVGPASQAAVLSGPGASHYESRADALVFEVWEVHRIFPQRVAIEARGKACKSFQAYQAEARAAPNHRDILGGAK